MIFVRDIDLVGRLEDNDYHFDENFKVAIKGNHWWFFPHETNGKLGILSQNRIDKKKILFGTPMFEYDLLDVYNSLRMLEEDLINYTPNVKAYLRNIVIGASVLGVLSNVWVGAICGGLGEAMITKLNKSSYRTTLKNTKDTVEGSYSGFVGKEAIKYLEI